MWRSSRNARGEGAWSPPQLHQRGRREVTDEPPKIWIDQYDLNLGVQGGDQETLDDVREHFDDLLEEAVDRDPKLGEGEPDSRGVQ